MLFLTMPDKQVMVYRLELVVSPDLPGTGVAYYELEATLGLKVRTVKQSLIAASDLNPAEAQAKATAQEAERRQALEAALAKESEAALATSAGAMTLSQQLARLAYQATGDDWKPLHDSAQKDVVAYRVAVGLALLRMDRFEEAYALSASMTGNFESLEAFRRLLLVEATHRRDGLRANALLQAMQERNAVQSETELEWYLANPSRTSPAQLIAHLRSRKDAQAMDQGLRMALSRWDHSTTLAQRRELIGAMSSDQVRLDSMMTDAVMHAVVDPDLDAFNAHCELYPPFKQTSTYRGLYLTLLTKTGHLAEAKPLLDAYMKDADLEPRRLADILAALGDPRATSYYRQANQARAKTLEDSFAKLNGRKPWPDEVDDYVRTLAALGSREKAATAAKTYDMYVNWRTWIGPVIALYGEGGDKAAAKAWRDSLAPKNDFWEQALVAEINLGFAKWEMAHGTRSEYEALLGLAFNGAIAANHGIVAYNAAQTQSKDRVWWRVGLTTKKHAPYNSVAQHLIDARQDDRLLELLKALQDEARVADDVRDCWKDAAMRLATLMRYDSVAKVLLAAPGGWEENWYTAMLSETVRVAAADAGAPWVKQLANRLEKPNWKAEVLRAAIIADANASKAADAQALLPDLLAAVQAGANPGHQAYGALGVAMAHVKAGDLAAGLAAYRQSTGTLAETFVLRRYNGREAMAVLQELGRDLAARTDATGLAIWLAAAQNPPERAYLALGIAEGLHARGK